MNESNITTDGPDHALPHLRVDLFWVPVYITFYFPIMLISITGNAMVLMAFIREPEIRKRRHNYFIASLALVDLLTGLIAVPCTVIARLLVTPFTCMARTRPILHVPAYTLCAASVNHLVVISFDRYLAVTKVLKYQSVMTQRRCFCLIGVAWIIALSFGLTPVLGRMKNPADLSICDGHRYQAKSVTLHSLAIIVLIPAILITVIGIYIRVLVIARKASHVRTNFSNATNSTPSERETTARLRATITMAMVLGAFIFCWLPTVFKHIYEIKHWYDFHVMFTLRTIVEIMAYMNSTVNPVIYGYRNHLFRKSYKKFLSLFFKRSSHQRFDHSKAKSVTVRFQLTSTSCESEAVQFKSLSPES